MSKNEYGVLSEREEQVLLLSTKGLTDKEIARKLNLSIATVNTYWVRIRTKLGGANRAELVAAALHKNAELTLTAKELENQRLISEVVRRAEAERALRDSQNRLQAIIDGTPVVVFIKDPQGRYTLVNKEFEAVMGRSRKEILGKRDRDIIGAEIGEIHRAQDQAIIETGEPYESEVAIETANGVKYFLSVKFPLVDSEGTRVAVCGFAREITARIEFEQELQKSEKRYRALIENSSDIITLLDSSGNILYASPSIEKVLGFAPEQIVGQNAFRHICREDLRVIKRDFKGLLSAPGSTLVAEYRIRDANGDIRNVEGLGANLLDDPAVGAVVLNYRDVTTRKQSEKRLAAQLAVAKVLAESATIPDAADQVSQSLCTILSFDYGAMWLSTPDGGLRWVGGWHSPSPGLAEFAASSKDLTFSEETSFPRVVIGGRMPVWLSNLHDSKLMRIDAIGKSGLRSAIGLPVLAGEEILGVFEFFSMNSAPLDEEFLNVLDIIGHQIGQFVKRKTAEAEELRLAKQLSVVNEELDQSVATIEEERRRYRDLFEQAPDGYVVTDLKGKILEANKAALELFSCEDSDCVGKSLRDFVVQDLKDAFSAGFSSLPELDSIHEWELKIRPKDRPVFDASMSVTVVRDARGGAVAHRWLVRDVSKRKFAEHELKTANEALDRRVRTRTIEFEESNLRLQEEIRERKQAEQDLLNSHQFANSVIECSVDGIIGFDKQCRFTVWNKSMEVLSGVNKEDVLGQYAFEMFPFLADIGEDDYFHRTLRGESRVSTNRPYTIVSTGRTGFFDAHYSPIRNDRNEIIGGLAVVRQTEASKGQKAELH